jgi:Gas vesicle protein G
MSLNTAEPFLGTIIMKGRVQRYAYRRNVLFRTDLLARVRRNNRRKEKMFILDDLLIGLPAKGLMGVFKEVYEMAQAEFTDEAKIKEELLRLQTLYEIDQIPEEEYEQKEAALLERLAIAREASASLV